MMTISSLGITDCKTFGYGAQGAYSVDDHGLQGGYGH